MHIQYTFNAFCKIVIRYAAIDKILKLRRRQEREIFPDYLMNEKFVQLALQRLMEGKDHPLRNNRPKPMRVPRTQSTLFFPTTPDLSATFPKYTVRSTPRLRNM